MEEKVTLIDTIASNVGYFAGLITIIALAFAIAVFAEKKAGANPGKKVFNARNMAVIGVFSAISFVLMLFDTPLFFAPAFYQFDFSDIPALIGGFAAGPIVGVMIEFIKVLLNLVIQGSDTAFVGEIANFVVGAALIIPSSVFYSFHKTRNGALISCLLGAVSITFAGSFLNAVFLLPAFAVLYGTTVDNLVAAGTAINPAIDNVATFCLLTVAPFNLLKGVVDSLITFVVYKRLSPIFKADSFVIKKRDKKEIKVEG